MIGEILGAVGSIAGGLLGRDAQEDALEQQAELQRENIALQKQFAQEGIRWRVSDAQHAGIHPLYALGAAIPTYSPSSMAFPTTDPLGGNLGQMGQDIGRAIEAMKTPEEKEKSKLDELAVERAELENQLLRARIAKETQTQQPGMPSTLPSAIPGQEHGLGRAGRGVTVKPAEVTATEPGRPSLEQGPVPGVRFERTATGFRPHPSKGLGIDDADMGNLQALEWYWSNRFVPSLGANQKPPPAAWLPPGASHWEWSAWDQEYQPRWIPEGATQWPPSRLSAYDRATDPGSYYYP